MWPLSRTSVPSPSLGRTLQCVCPPLYRKTSKDMDKHCYTKPGFPIVSSNLVRTSPFKWSVHGPCLGLKTLPEGGLLLEPLQKPVKAVPPTVNYYLNTWTLPVNVYFYLLICNYLLTGGSSGSGSEGIEEKEKSQKLYPNHSGKFSNHRM